MGYPTEWVLAPGSEKHPVANSANMELPAFKNCLRVSLSLSMLLSRGLALQVTQKNIMALYLWEAGFISSNNIVCLRFEILIRRDFESKSDFSDGMDSFAAGIIVLRRAG